MSIDTTTILAYSINPPRVTQHEYPWDADVALQPILA